MFQFQDSSTEKSTSGTGSNVNQIRRLKRNILKNPELKNDNHNDREQLKELTRERRRIDGSSPPETLARKNIIISKTFFQLYFLAELGPLEVKHYEVVYTPQAR